MTLTIVPEILIRQLYVLLVNLSVILFYCELTIIKPNNNVGIEKNT
jgi:hypothetical protein